MLIFELFLMISLFFYVFIWKNHSNSIRFYKKILIRYIYLVKMTLKDHTTVKNICDVIFKKVP